MTDSQFEFESLGGGRFAIRGVFGFRTARAVLERGATLFGDTQVIKVDLSGVTEADSAGLALLIEWVNWARQRQREIRFFDIPPQIQAIAKISEVADLLQAGASWTDEKVKREA